MRLIKKIHKKTYIQGVNLIDIWFGFCYMQTERPCVQLSGVNARYPHSEVWSARSHVLLTVCKQMCPGRIEGSPTQLTSCA